MRSTALLIVVFALVLSGCGGSGGFDRNPVLGGNENPPPPNPGDACVTAKVSWNAPTQLTDGSPIPVGFLVGYTLYHGTTSGQYSDEILIEGGATEYFEVDNLATNIPHYFAMRARASDGSSSVLTSEVVFLKTECTMVHVPLDPQQIRSRGVRKITGEFNKLF